MTVDKEKKILEREDSFPEHIPVVPLDIEREKAKEQARKLAEDLRKKTGKVEPIIITKEGKAKKASDLTYFEQEDEIIRCISDPVYFIETYLTVFDQTQGVAGMIVSFKLFDFQKELIQTYRENRFVVANKYRQAGISTTTCAYIAWYIMFNKNRQVAIIANKLETARDEIMSDVVLFIESCPEWLRPKTGKETKGKYKDTQKLKIYDNDSKLGAFSAKGGLRGMTPTLIFWDETAWTEKGDTFWTAAKPTLGTGGGAIMVSTPSGLDAVFYKHFNEARKGKNNFKAVELWWFNDPRYNKELGWVKNKNKENEIRLKDENWDKARRIQMMDDGWEATSPWFEEQVMDANGDMRKIAQELLCVGGDSLITIRNKKTNNIETLKISEFYKRLEEQNNSCEYLFKNTILMDKNILIKLLKTVENLSDYYIKGGTSKFNKDFPNILNLINIYTSEMQVYSSNKILEAKIKYLINYNGNINNITINNKIMIFDKNIKNFKIANINSAKKQWDACNIELSNINELYDEDTTRELLKNNYTEYFGKSGNRKLLKKDKKLYLSLFHHTKEFDLLNKNLNKFSYRLYFFVNRINIYCEKHNHLKHWRLSDKNIDIVCSKCNPKYPSKEWYIEKYGDDWEIYVNKRKEALSNLKVNGLEWHKKKYGDVDGISKYKKNVEDKVNNICKLKRNRYSKISQELFWSIYDKLQNKENVYFYELNQEYVLRIPSKYCYNKTVIILDFIQDKNIIEYNGNYWHSKENDDIKYNILKEMGYNIMVVTSSDYNRNKKDEKIIENCLNFLQC